MTPARCFFLLIFLVSCAASFSQTQIIDSLQKIIDEGKNDVEENRTLNRIAREYLRTNPAKAKTYLYAAIQLAGRLKNPESMGAALSQICILHMTTGNKDSAAWYLASLKEMVAGSNSPKVVSNYNYTAGLFYRKQGNFKAALPFMIADLNELLAVAAGHPDLETETSIAGQYLNIGNNMIDIGNYAGALKYHLKSLQLFEKVDNKRGISFCYQGVGSDFISLGRFAEAIPYLAKSVVLKTALNDKRGVATVNGNYGTAYKGLGDFEKALYYSNEAWQSFHELKLLPDEARMDVQLGKIYVGKNDGRLAQPYFDKAALLADQLKDSSLALSVAAEKIALKSSIVQQKKESQKLMASLQNAVEMGDKNQELVSYQYLADYYSNNKQYDKALDFTRKLYRSSDSVGNKNLQLQVKKMEQQYNIEKKENEIALLKKDQQLDHLSLQKQKNFQAGAIIFLGLLILIAFLLVNRYRVVQRATRLIEMERMRNSLARDLHDDIGSTLTSINILSKVALQQQNGADPLMLSNLQKIKDRSSAIMESVSDIVWAINPQNDTTEQMISRMKEFAAEILEPLNINYHFMEEGDLAAITFDIKKRKDFYLLFKEAINNAAKYSGCNNLLILLKQEGPSLHLSVKDDGAGFNQLEVKNGNGLRNMRDRAAAMGAGITIQTAIGSGTGIAVEVPIT